MHRRRALALALLLVVSALGPAVGSAAAEDWEIEGGHYYTQTAGDGRGYAVTDEGGIR